MFEILVGTKIKFMERRKAAYIFSILLVLASIASLVAHGGPRESIDFTGGSVLSVGFASPMQVGDVRAAAVAARMEGAEIQLADEGAQAIIRFRPEEGDTTNAFEAFRKGMESVVSGSSAGITLRSLDSVGPKIGDELERKAAMAILISLGLILVYIGIRFTRISFGIGAVAALFHDILITLGVFSVLGFEVSLTVVAAFLTIGGYSINDTIVVFDRIRENMGLSRRLSFQEIVDKSLNQTLSRTVLTSSTTLIAVLCLYILGGPVIHDFAFAMLIGVVIGTYSSIFVASSLALDISNWWTRKRLASEHKNKSKAKAKSKTKTATAT